jgi:hypothetical protein
MTSNNHIVSEPIGISPVSIGIQPEKLKAILSPAVIICITVICVATIGGIVFLTAIGNDTSGYVNNIIRAVQWAGLMVTQIVIGKRLIGNVNEAKVIASSANDNATLANQQSIVNGNKTDEILNGFMSQQINKVLDSRPANMNADSMNALLDERQGAVNAPDANDDFDFGAEDLEPTDMSMNDNEKVSAE